VQQKKRKKALLYDTRPKRRRKAAIIGDELDEMIQYETAYRENIPVNLENSIRAEAADTSIEKLTDALDMIREAY